MTITGHAAGVPFLAIPPANNPENKPLVVVWHLLDAPRTEVAMASALPLNGVDAWRVYLGLPLTGSRGPAGGFDEFIKLAMEDVITNIYEPLTTQAVSEFPAALAALREQLPVNEQLSLVGGSIGSMVVLRVLTETGVKVDKVALMSPAIQMAGMISTAEKGFGVTYPWTEATRAVAAHLDFPARASEITLPVLIVAGEQDEPGFTGPAEQLWSKLPAGSSFVKVPGMGHALAEEPGMEAAPQTANAAQVDAIVTDWLSR